MAVTPARVVLFLFGLFLAAGIVAYGSGAFQREEAQGSGTVAAVAPGTSSSNGLAADGGGASNAQNTAAPQPLQAEPPADAPDTTKAGASAGHVQAPSFDLLRVEPNGSVVVAGQAAAGAAVEVVSGSTVLGNTVAGPQGDFAIVLEEPLSGGDYSLVLRSTDKGSAATSVETAIVSVPKDKSGQVLALVEQPGEPSRLITVPEAPAASNDAAPATPQPPAEQAAGAASPAPTPSTDTPHASAATQQTGEARPSDPVAAVPAGETAARAPAAVASAPTEQSAAQAPATGENASVQQPAASAPSAAAAPQAEAQQTAAAAASPAGTTTNDPSAPASAGGTAASQQPAATPPAPVPPAGEAEEKQVAAAGPASAGNVAAPGTSTQGNNETARPQRRSPAVEAVEIEAGMVYIAGRAAPGSTLRVYANNLFLGQVIASEAGRFLVEAQQDLPVGSYTIRVDALGPDGRTVVARAAVPFDREAGEAVAAVAPAVVESNATAPVEAAPPSVAPPASAPAGAVAPAAPPPLAPEAEPSQASPAATRTAARVGQPQTVQEAGTSRTASPVETTAQKPVETATQAPEDSTRRAEIVGGSPVAPAETTAPALQSAKGAVIIRRGDTLWKISRRAYGRGTRYSTIYLANQDQIEDPDMIWPGQVFVMPKTSRDGHEVDMSKLGAQAVAGDQVVESE
ncbi:LysM peptidoglycan-binding domain-containing protein [Tianweitania sediminis]|nr:LysM peptidoglycan-binding domain-containing protein [Tianweitania sediminis]